MREGEDLSHIRTILKDDEQVVEVETEPTQHQKVKRSTRKRTQPIRLNDYERFLGQAIRENGDLIEESTLAESEPIDHVQAMQYENQPNARNWEIKAIKKYNMGTGSLFRKEGNRC